MYNGEENLFKGGARCSTYYSIKELAKFVSQTQKCLAWNIGLFFTVFYDRDIFRYQTFEEDNG